MNPEIHSVDEASAEALLSSLRTIAAAERRKHASVFNYWLSIRRDRQFPPIRDLDPLEISDAGPYSILLEMIGGGEDAEIRHLGQAIKGDVSVEKIGEAPNPSLLSCIASRLPVVAACREAFAFEDKFETETGATCCWVTLLPFSATGTWIDYVYGFVSLKPDKAEAAPEVAKDLPDEAPLELVEEPAPMTETVEPEPVAEVAESEEDQGDEAPMPDGKPSFSTKFFESLSNVKGFYGRPVEVEPVEVELELPTLPIVEQEPPEAIDGQEHEPAEFTATEGSAEPMTAEAADESIAAEDAAPGADQPTEPTSTLEGTLHSKLTEVRAKADEARQAKLRANTALYEGLGAAYDFALDAEEAPEEYLRLVEAQGLKIQLRSPMKPVVKLAFDGMCDDSTIKQLEAILAWAFDQELPRGTLAERIEEAGGIGPILSGEAKAA
ncbi:MAG TPA: hypothetical protein VJM15_01775 [Sphingomicrobium sp.]|nr:hypothetical protein [Sphingomicrobium sp.]